MVEKKSGGVLFILIRISVCWLVSLALNFLTIITTATNRRDDRGSNSSSGGGMAFMPHFWIGPDLVLVSIQTGVRPLPATTSGTKPAEFL